MSDYTRADNGKPVKVYPANTTRNRFGNSHPYLFKFTEKDKNHTNQFNSQNIVVYRYAELLLMLSEISNELGNGQEMTYLQPVLYRAGVTDRNEYSDVKAYFRDAIMDEYKLNKEISKGSRAKTILEDSLFIETFDTLKDTYTNQIMNTSYKDSEARTAIWVAYHQLDKVRDHLAEIMNTGKLASRQLEEIKKLK